MFDSTMSSSVNVKSFDSYHKANKWINDNRESTDTYSIVDNNDFYIDFSISDYTKAHIKSKLEDGIKSFKTDGIYFDLIICGVLHDDKIQTYNHGMLDSNSILDKQIRELCENGNTNDLLEYIVNNVISCTLCNHLNYGTDYSIAMIWKNTTGSLRNKVWSYHLLLRFDPHIFSFDIIDNLCSFSNDKTIIESTGESGFFFKQYKTFVPVLNVKCDKMNVNTIITTSILRTKYNKYFPILDEYASVLQDSVLTQIDDSNVNYIVREIINDIVIPIEDFKSFTNILNLTPFIGWSGTLFTNAKSLFNAYNQFYCSKFSYEIIYDENNV